jgi:glycosyltransferase involved in cell wall biosynthesis
MKKTVISLYQRLRTTFYFYGFFGGVLKIINIFGVHLRHWVKRNLKRHRFNVRVDELASIIETHKGFIDVLHFPIGWNNVMSQRYRHISIQMASFSGCLALYGGNWRVDKDLMVYDMTSEGVCVFDATDTSVQACVLRTLKASNAQKMVRIQSIDHQTSLSDVYSFLEAGFKVVYEYIDLLIPEIMRNLSGETLARHAAILADERITVLATSDKLFQDVGLHRERNYFLSTNGVDPNHWRLSSCIVPLDMLDLTAGDRIILGYHGTLANWIDYDLLRLAADDGRFEIVLIGLEHDNSFRESDLYHHPRVHYLGGKPYSILNHYASCYDIALLPFKKNDISDTVSPVKIFEYMAAGKPIVTTDLLECKKYRSCIIAESHEVFISRLEDAVARKNDEDYLLTLNIEAYENSWQRKAMDILEWVGTDIGEVK